MANSYIFSKYIGKYCSRAAGAHCINICVQTIGLEVQVWGPVEGWDTLLQRVDALKSAIKGTRPLLLEQGAVVVEPVKEGYRVITPWP